MAVHSASERNGSALTNYLIDRSTQGREECPMPILALLLAAAAPADSMEPNLQPLAFLVGSCWRGTLPDNSGIDTHCFTPMLRGHFLRDRHNVTPVGYSGETLYRWDSAARQIRLDYYSSDGLLMAGTASAGEHGLTFELGYVAGDGSPTVIRATWTRDGPDAYVVTAEARDHDGWRPVPGRARFQRVGPAPPD
jgi:hypothetical protein